MQHATTTTRRSSLSLRSESIYPNPSIEEKRPVVLPSNDLQSLLSYLDEGGDDGDLLHPVKSHHNVHNPVSTRYSRRSPSSPSTSYDHHQQQEPEDQSLPQHQQTEGSLRSSIRSQRSNNSTTTTNSTLHSSLTSLHNSFQSLGISGFTDFHTNNDNHENSTSTRNSLREFRNTLPNSRYRRGSPTIEDDYLDADNVVVDAAAAVKTASEEETVPSTPTTTTTSTTMTSPRVSSSPLEEETAFKEFCTTSSPSTVALRSNRFFPFHRTHSSPVGRASSCRNLERNDHYDAARSITPSSSQRRSLTSSTSFVSMEHCAKDSIIITSPVTDGSSNKRNARRHLYLRSQSVAALPEHCQQEQPSPLPQQQQQQQEPEPLVHVKNLTLKDRRKSGGKTGQYSGTVSRRTGLPHGKGRLEFDNDDAGGYYQGEFIHGVWHGIGQYSNQTHGGGGDKFVGLVEQNRPASGTLTYQDGRIFEGEFCSKNGTIYNGLMTYVDGATYKGTFHRHKRHGQGIYQYTDGSVYTGDFRHDVVEGEGELVWATGARYQGHWIAGKPHGFGREYGEDGETLRHEGLWHEGKIVA